MVRKIATCHLASFLILLSVASRCASQEQGVQFSFTDRADAVGTSVASELGGTHFSLHDAPQAEEAQPLFYPQCVDHAPGWPLKPCQEKPGDISRKGCPPFRYTLPDCERAGQPHEVAWWARCAVNQQYSAWYVGGGSAWILPRQARPKKADEGTWGLDYDGLFLPRRVWLRWSHDRAQGGLGAYQTDGEPEILARLKDHDLRPH